MFLHASFSSSLCALHRIRSHQTSHLSSCPCSFISFILIYNLIFMFILILIITYLFIVDPDWGLSVTQRLLNLLDTISSMVNEKKVGQEQAKEVEEEEENQEHAQDHYKERNRSRSRTITPQLDTSPARLLLVEVAATIKFFISKFSFVRASFCFRTSSLSCNYGMQSDVRDGVRTARGSSTSSEHDSRMSPRSLLLHALHTAEPLPSTATSTVTHRSSSGSSTGSASNSRKLRKVNLSLAFTTHLTSTVLPS